MSKLPIGLAVSSLCLVVSACGGGGSSDSATAPAGGESAQAPISQPNKSDPQPQNPNGNTPESPMDQSPSLDGVQWKMTEISCPCNPSDLNDEGKVLLTITTNKLPIRDEPIYQSIFTVDENGVYHGGFGPWQRTVASSFNNAGDIVGVGVTAGIEGPTSLVETFLYKDGAYVSVPTGTSLISNTGYLAGSALIENSSGSPTEPTAFYRAFIYANGSKQSINPLPGHHSTSAFALNDSGQVAGMSSNATTAQAFVYGNGKTKGLGVLPGSNASLAADINNKGQVAGYSGISDGSGIWQTYRPFIYTNGVMKELPSLGMGGLARSINDHGQVVGILGKADGFYPETTAFIYSGGKTIDLNTLPEVMERGFRLKAALKINNAGQILVSTGNPQFFLLTPIRSQQAP